MLSEKVLSAIKEYDMIRAGETVCAAFSGGADSTALLLLLKELSKQLDFTLTAVHINHLLRGDESDGDESFCRELCKELNVPLTVFRKDAAEYSRARGMSVETGAREMRYELFGTLEADRIASAHNLNDNAETLLFRLARGTGLKGLAGIPPVRDSIIRPLIFCARDEIEEYLKDRGQAFVTDSTNLSDDYARNKIRHRIMPEMTAVHGAFPECVPQMTMSFAEDEDYLSSVAAKHADDDLRTLHPAIKNRVIINLLREHKLKVSAAKVSEICDVLDEGKICIEDGVYAVCRDGKVKITGGKKTPPEPVNITVMGEYPFYGDKTVIIKKETRENARFNGIVNKKLTIQCADYDKIQGGVLLRNRLRSDRIKPAGQPHTKELRKILQERLPAEEREISAVLADSEGVFWAEHAGIADRVKPDENTKTLLIIKTETKGKQNG